MKIYIDFKLENVASKFSTAIWRKTSVNRYYNSARDARKFHNLKNCKYHYEDSEGNVIRAYNNAMLDSYGRRMK